MKKMEDMIVLWKNWQPNVHYVAPSRVTNYHYALYEVNRVNKPLFLNGEINDILSVIANSKLAATITSPFNNYVLNGEHLNDAITLAKQNNIQHDIVETAVGNTHVFSKNKKMNKKIEKAIVNHDPAQLGRLLGYPQKSIQQYLKTAQKTILNHINNKTLPKQYTVDDNYLKIFYKHKPDFKISGSWFEK
jgi:hypothetical protein